MCFMMQHEQKLFDSYYSGINYYIKNKRIIFEILMIFFYKCIIIKVTDKMIVKNKAIPTMNRLLLIQWYVYW